MQLSEVLRLFDSPLSQEQCWSICYGTCRTLIKKRREDHQRRERIRYILSLDSLILTQRGDIEILHSEPNFQDIQNDSEVIFAVGNLICRCLDHGLNEEEICEVSFQDDLAELIGGMVLQNSEFDEGIGDAESLNESWESRKFYANQHRSFGKLSEVVRFCEARLLRRNIERNTHYSNVSKALYVEASELKAFLGHVLHDFAEENQVSLDEIQGPELAKKYVKDWAKLWLKVMNELRQKTKERRDELTPEDYQSTPFDMMNKDERVKGGSVIKRVDSLPNDAEDRIYNFLKSRVSSHEKLQCDETDHVTDQKNLKHTTIESSYLHKKGNTTIESTNSGDSKWEKFEVDDTLEEDFLNGSYVSDDDENIGEKISEKCNTEKDTRSIELAIDDHEDALPTISVNASLDHRRNTFAGLASNNRLFKSEMNLHETSISNDSEEEFTKIGSSLVEIFKIRQEITRSELETCRNPDLVNSKKCFGCKAVKFTLFQRSRQCAVCSRKYCLKCMRENTIVSPEVVSAVPINVGVVYSGNPSPLLNSSLHLCRSMFNLGSQRRLDNKLPWSKNSNSIKLAMCVDCEQFLKSIEREKSSQKWTVRLELDL